MSNVESNGDHVIAEYDGNNNLLRKYIDGPGTDEPICMIEVADSNATYYYHYDSHGSVVALSDSTGDTVQTYEYSVYGQVAVEDANHPNPYMFAARRFDMEIGLYYNRARYYNPYTGRFLQTDPIGYSDGINWYSYCGNNPVRGVDPSGLNYKFLDLNGGNKLRFATLGGSVLWTGKNLNEWLIWAQGNEEFDEAWMKSQIGYELSRTLEGGNEIRDEDWMFWMLQIVRFLGPSGSDIKALEDKLAEGKDVKVVLNKTEWSNRFVGYNFYKGGPGYFHLMWNPDWTQMMTKDVPATTVPSNKWFNFPALAGLSHELAHGGDWAYKGIENWYNSEKRAMVAENVSRYAFYKKVPGYGWVVPRPGLTRLNDEDISWETYNSNRRIYPTLK